MSGHVIKNAVLLLRGRLPEETRPVTRRQKLGKIDLRFLAKTQLGVLVPVLIIAAIAICAVVPSWIAPFAPTDMDDNAILAAPSLHHLLGTDEFGRDICSLLIYGAQRSVAIGLSAILFVSVVGTSIGLLSGFVGGKTDMALMRLIDIWMSIPPMLLALIIAAALGGSFDAIIAAIGSMVLPPFARVIRAQVIAVKARPFVAASYALGASPFRVMLRHVVPHILSQFLILTTLGLGQAILVGATLSFIGIGVIDDTPDWGFLLSQGRDYLTDAWWYATFPGLAITALAVSVNLLGDSLKSRFDPTHHQR
jgi:peptide/nickel transport system permease protein